MVPHQTAQKCCGQLCWKQDQAERAGHEAWQRGHYLGLRRHQSRFLHSLLPVSSGPQHGKGWWLFLHVSRQHQDNTGQTGALWQFPQQQVPYQDLPAAEAWISVQAFFSNQYHLQFLGSGGSSKAQEQPQQSVSTELGTATDKDKELADTLANQLKATKAELASISKKLKVLEAQRRQAARLSRAHEKEHQSINPELYGRLKDIRDQCNALYLDQQRLHHSKSQDQSHLYMLNKKIRGQAVVAPKPVPAPPSFGPKTKIQGADPGLVTMASGICSDQKMLFESINRYEALQDSQETVHHGMDQDVPFQMTANVVNAAVSTKTSPTNSSKKKQEKRVKSKCRLRRFYGKHCSQHRKEMGSKSFVTFTGSWHGVSTYIRVALGGPPSHTAADLQLMVKAKSSPRTSLL